MGERLGGALRVGEAVVESRQGVPHGALAGPVQALAQPAGLGHQADQPFGGRPGLLVCLGVAPPLDAQVLAHVGLHGGEPQAHGLLQPIHVPRPLDRDPYPGDLLLHLLAQGLAALLGGLAVEAGPGQVVPQLGQPLADVAEKALEAPFLLLEAPAHPAHQVGDGPDEGRELHRQNRSAQAVEQLRHGVALRLPGLQAMEDLHEDVLGRDRPGRAECVHRGAALSLARGGGMQGGIGQIARDGREARALRVLPVRFPEPLELGREVGVGLDRGQRHPAQGPAQKPLDLRPPALLLLDLVEAVQIAGLPVVDRVFGPGSRLWHLGSDRVWG